MHGSVSFQSHFKHAKSCTCLFISLQLLPLDYSSYLYRSNKLEGTMKVVRCVGLRASVGFGMGKCVCLRMCACMCVRTRGHGTIVPIL